MDSTVVLERDRERPGGDLLAIKFGGRDAVLHPLRILDHDLESRRAASKRYLETGPGPWNARIEEQCTALDTKAENALDAGALHPAGGTRVPSPAAAPDMARSGVDVGGYDIGFDLVAVHVDARAGVVDRIKHPEERRCLVALPEACEGH